MGPFLNDENIFNEILNTFKNVDENINFTLEAPQSVKHFGLNYLDRRQRRKI